MKKAIALLLSVIMLFSLAACGSGSDKSDDSGSAKISTLKVGTANSLGTCLANDYNGDCYTAIYMVFDSLFKYDPDTKEVGSDVLSDWGYSEDGMTLTLTLKDNITFSNGDKATGEDLLCSISNDTERGTLIAPFFTPYDFENATVDGNTVSVPLTSPFSPKIWEIGNLCLYDKSWSESVGWDSEEWTTGPVGSGPFKVSEYKTDSHIFLEKRDDYWGDFECDYDRIEIYYYGEPATMYMDLENGDIALALEVLDNDYARGLAGEENIAVDTISAGENRILSIDDGNEFLSDVNVRLAIAYGVNWAEVADIGTGGLSPVATSLIISSSDYYKNVGAYEYDPDKARQLLADAGYSDGDITIKLVSTDEDDQVKMSTKLQADLKDIGITLDFVTLDFPSALATWLEGGTDLMWQDSSIGSIISEPFASLRATWDDLGGMPASIVNDDTYQTYLDNSIFTTDPEVRRENLDKLQEYNKENAFVIPVLEENIAIAWRTDIIKDPNLLNATDANLRNIEFVG